MSQAAVRQVRRDLRRAVGEDALATIGELQQNLERLANSVGTAHQRLGNHIEDATAARFNHDGWIHDLRQQLAVLAQEHKMLREAYIEHERACLTLRGRLRWLLTGR